MRPGKRLITCPENHETAAIDINLLQRMSDCSRWPEKAGCDQACLRQLANSPNDCLVKTIVASWYAGKSCAICRRSIAPVVWHERPPALLAPDGTTHEWAEMRPEELPKIFATHALICWTCHLAESFRREHPELVFERPRPAAKHSTLQPTTAVY